MKFDFSPRSQILETLSGAGVIFFFNRLRRAFGPLRKYQLEYFYALMHVICFKRLSNYSKFFLLCAQLRTSDLRLPVWTRRLLAPLRFDRFLASFSCRLLVGC